MKTQERTTVELARRPQVSNRGMEELRMLFLRYTDNYLPTWFSHLWEVKQSDPYKTVTTKTGDVYPVRYSGKIAKRLAQIAKTHFHVKLTNEQVSNLGNVASQHKITSDSITYDITDRFDWQSGDFGDSGSCFWSDRSAAKPAMEENDFRAIRFYNDDQGIARAWIAPLDSDSCVIFNAYAKRNTWISQNGSTLSAMATFLAEQHSFANSRKVSLYNNGTDSGTLWINNGTGIVLYNDNRPKDYIDLRIDIDQDWCPMCGECVSQESMYYVESENRSICECCYCDHFSHCENCEEVYRSDNMYFHDDQCLCAYCYNENYAECEDCGEVCEKSDLTDGLCYDCSAGKLAVCDDCGEVYEIEDGIPQSCTRKRLKRNPPYMGEWRMRCNGPIMVHCAECGESVPFEHTHPDIDSLRHCDKCKPHMTVECAICKILKMQKHTSKTNDHFYCLYCQPPLFTINSVFLRIGA